MQKRIMFTTLILLAYGCVPQGTRDLLPAEVEILDNFVERWDAWAEAHPNYEPVSDQCYQELASVGIFVAYSHEEFKGVTGWCGPRDGVFDPENEDECDNDGLWGQARYGYGDRHRLIIIASTSDWCATLPHEFLHHLSRCMGAGGDELHQHAYWEISPPGAFQQTQGPLDPNFTGCE